MSKSKKATEVIEEPVVVSEFPKLIDTETDESYRVRYLFFGTIVDTTTSTSNTYLMEDGSKQIRYTSTIYRKYFGLFKRLKEVYGNTYFDRSSIKSSND